MSLVPIIYTSLVLFFGVLLIVLFISYLSFKARGKANPVIEEEIRKHKEIINPQPVFIRKEQSSFNIPSQTIMIYKRQVSNPKEQSSKPIILPSDYFGQNKDKNINKVEEIKPRVDKKEKELKLHQTIINRSRIEVMNQSDKYQSKEVRINRKTSEFTYKDISQFNILTFYSDNNNERDLVALSAYPTQHAV